MQTYTSKLHLEENRQEWLDRLKAGERHLLKALYQFYRLDFVSWIQRTSSCSEIEAVDIFQDTVIAIYHNIQKGTLKQFDKGIRSYLFTVGKYIYLRKASKKKQIRTNSFEEVHQEVGQLVDTPSADSLENEQQRLILMLLKRMKEPCKSILDLFYYQNKSMKEIREILNYGSVGVVKVQKLRCMKKLRAAAEKIQKK